MSFSNQILLSKRPRFDNNENKRRKARIHTKHQQIDTSENHEKKDVVDYNINGYGCVPFLPHSKLINCPSNWGKRTKA